MLVVQWEGRVEAGGGGVYLEFWGGSGGESGPLAVEQYNLLSGLSTGAKESGKM